MGKHLYLQGQLIKEVTIPSDVTTIPVSAFQGNEDITKVAIPANVTTIGYQAFRKCTNLVSVSLPEDGSIETIPHDCFFQCSKLSSINIPASVKTFAGQGTFAYTAFTSFEIPETVEQLSTYMFWHCEKLKKLTIKAPVFSLPQYFCSYCYSLENIDLPSSLAILGYASLEYCNLKQLTLSASIRIIQKEALLYGGRFDEETRIWTFNDPPLKKLVILSETPPSCDSQAFLYGKLDSYYSYLKDVTLYVPSTAVRDYKADDFWKQAKAILPIEKCKAPTITFKDGKLTVSSATSGAECITEITTEDIGTYSNGVIPLSMTYTVKSYAKAVGYEDSDVVTTTLDLGTMLKSIGDVNKDGTVDVADIATIIDIMAGK